MDLSFEEMNNQYSDSDSSSPDADHKDGDHSLEKSWIFQDKKPFTIKEDILSLRYKKQWCDTVIRVKHKITYAHKAILCMECEMFRGMFRSNFLENMKNEIDLSHVFADINVANTFIDYLYIGRITLSDQNIKEVLGAAHMTLMQKLESHCIQFLLHRLSVANVIETMMMAELYEASDLIEVCDCLLQKSEHSIIWSPEIPAMEPRNFLAFLKSEVISSYHKSTRDSLVICWVSVNLRKRIHYVKHLLKNCQFDRQDLDCLPLSQEKTRKLLTWFKTQKITLGSSNVLSVAFADENGHFPLIGNWTIVVQSFCGKTGFYCPELKKWHVVSLPVIDGELIGLLENKYLAYLDAEMNIITYIHLPSGKIKTTSIPGSYPINYYKNCEFGSSQPYHYFCRNGVLYGISPIASEHHIIEGWGVYRYFFGKTPGWQILGDMTFLRDFTSSSNQKSRMNMSAISDPSSTVPQEPIVYIFLQQELQSQTKSATFLYNHQFREYYSFTACRSIGNFLNIFVLPEVAFVARFNTVIGFIDLPAEVNFTDEAQLGRVELFYHSRNSPTKDNYIALDIPKPNHLSIKLATSTPSRVGCSKDAHLFDSHIYMAAHLTPLDYQIFIYDLDNQCKGPIPTVPFPTGREVRMKPIRTTQSITHLVKTFANQNLGRNAMEQNNREKYFVNWTFKAWDGQYKILDEPDLERQETSEILQTNSAD